MALFFEHGNSTVRQTLEGDAEASGLLAKGHHDKEDSNSYGWISQWISRGSRAEGWRRSAGLCAAGQRRQNL